MDARNEGSGERWIEAKLAALQPANGWRPNPSKAYARLEQKQTAVVARVRRTLWLGYVVGLAGLLSLAFPGTRALAQKCLDACVVETGRIGDFVLARVVIRQQVGRQIRREGRRVAPDFVLTNASGQPVQLSKFRGKVVLLNFWATWCNPCRVETPWFIDLQNAYRDRELVVIGISLDEDGWSLVRPYIAEQRVNYHVVIGGDEIARLYGGLESLPTTLIIDRDGRIASTHVGLVSKGVYESDVRAILAER